MSQVDTTEITSWRDHFRKTHPSTSLRLNVYIVFFLICLSPTDYIHGDGSRSVVAKKGVEHNTESERLLMWKIERYSHLRRNFMLENSSPDIRMIGVADMVTTQSWVPGEKPIRMMSIAESKARMRLAASLIELPQKGHVVSRNSCTSGISAGELTALGKTIFSSRRNERILDDAKVWNSSKKKRRAHYAIRF